MRNILIIGAGRSATNLIQYLLERAECEDLFLTIGDLNPSSAEKLLQGHPRGSAVQLDIFQADQRREQIEKSDLVISMLPARFHMEAAKDCLELGKHMVTASYVSPEMKALDQEVKERVIDVLSIDN